MMPDKHLILLSIFIMQHFGYIIKYIVKVFVMKCNNNFLDTFVSDTSI